MSAQVINGKELVSSIREEIRADAAALTANGHQPGLVVVIVGKTRLRKSMSEIKLKHATT